MPEKHVKTITIQWILPLAVLFITVIVMLISFSVSSRERAREQVEKSLISTGENYGLRVKSILETVMGVQKPIATMLANKSEGNSAFTREVVSAIAANSEVYMAAFCSLDGGAVISDRNNGDLSGTSYFEKLKGNEPFYLFAKDDGVTGQDAIISVCPVKQGSRMRGYLLTFLDPERISRIVKKLEFDLNVFYLLIDNDGTVVSTYGVLDNTSLLPEDNFTDYLGENISEGQTTEMVKMRINNHISGVVYVDKEEENRLLVYSPVEIEQWYWIMGVNESYVKSQVNMAWETTSDMLMKLIIAVFIFLGLLAVINIITKIRISERNRALEDKADTDLLTDLNNKLATERKIKEYIRDNPEKQGVMFVLDIDNFKKINDTMGHAFGDEVLRTIGKQIRAEFRISDIIGRTGGDEFIIFLKDVKDDFMIQKEGQKVERFFRNFEAGEYVKYSATASVGAAIFPRDAKDFESLYKAADRALYIAKKRGKNQLAFYKCGEQ